jgi:hypothetical protein
LAGTTGAGVFTFESSIVPVGGGTVAEADLLTDLDFTWGGVRYTEATANTGLLGFDPSGDLTHAMFGTTCFDGGCNLPQQQEDWILIYNFPITPALVLTTFAYGAGDGFMNPDVRLCSGACAIPEPGTVPLLAIAATCFVILWRMGRFRVD